jgi:rod shape determining protein RodA
VYAFLNLAMVSSLVPVMGLPLPFVSWGGTALLTNMIGVGVLLNVARSVRRPRRVDARWQGARA